MYANTSPPSLFLLRLLGAVFFCALPTSKSSYPCRPGSLCTFILPLMQTQHLSRIFHVFSCPSSPSLSLYKFNHILITILLTKLIQHRRPPRGRPPETPWANFWVGAWPKNLWLPPDPQSREITPRQSLVVSPGGETSQLNIKILFNQHICKKSQSIDHFLVLCSVSYNRLAKQTISLLVVIKAENRGAP